MACRDPEGCRRRAERHAARLREQAEAGQRDLARWCDRSPEDRMLVFSSHAKRRLKQRAVAEHEVRAIVEHGEVIDRFARGNLVEILVLGYVNVGRRWRALHVKLAFLRLVPREMWVKTVYDPSTQPWRWADGFRRRVCWCGAEDDE